MRINHNLSAINTHRQLTGNTSYLQKSVERLSSGLRINRAGDDAAGLAISEKMRGQIRGLNQASRNAQDAISLIQTAEAAMSTTHNILQRMRELAVQSANDSSTDSDRFQLQKEIDQLRSEIDRVAFTTEFNSKKLLNGTLTASQKLQGSHVQSAGFRVEDFVASQGTVTAGLSITERGSIQSVTGTGMNAVGFNSLDDYTKIIAGINDHFAFEINGISGSGTIAASALEGYTRAQLALAVERAITDTLTATDYNYEKYQIGVSVAADNMLVFTAKEAGEHSSLRIKSPASSEASALGAIGFAGYEGKYEGNVDLSAGFTVAAGATNGSFKMIVGGTSGQITLDSGTYSKTVIISSLQTELDRLFGTNTIIVGDQDADGKIELRSTALISQFLITSGSFSDSGTIGLFGFASGIGSGSGGIIRSGSVLYISGTNSVLGYSNGINIAKDTNDQFIISVDGKIEQTITLSAMLYESKEALVHEINNQIGTNAVLTGKVRARLTSEEKIEFVSSQSGGLSSVRIRDPDSVFRSSLGTFGFGPSAGGISGLVDIANGINLAGTSSGNAALLNYMFDVTLGNKVATINLLDQKNIVQSGLNSNNGGLSSRDAIVRALQAELDKQFGKGSLSVTTKSVSAGAAEYLKISPITETSRFAIYSVSNGSGASILFNNGLSAGQGMAGVLGSTPTNISTTGLDGIHRLLATSTFLKDLTDSDGNNLGLTAGNVITFEGTQSGKYFKKDMVLQEGSTVGDLMGMMRSIEAFKGATVSLDLVRGLIDIKGMSGAAFDLSSLELNARRSLTDDTPIGQFNRPMGNFKVLQHAQDSKEDHSLVIQVGANQGITDRIDIREVSASSLKLNFISVSSKQEASSSINVIENAMERISDERAKLGAIQNRLENTIFDLGIFSENLTASESRIRDIDMAHESMGVVKYSILSRASQAMLAQANQQASTVLYLLR